MASVAYQLMLEYEAEAQRAATAGDFERKFTFDSAVSIVNNVMHGRAFAQVEPLVRDALVRNSTADFCSPAEQAAYRDAVELLDLFIAVNELNKG